MRPNHHTKVIEGDEYTFKVDSNAERSILFGDEKSQFKNVNMQVVCEKQSYNPGDIVNGVIYIQTRSHIDCRFVFLDFFGREEAGPIEVENEERGFEGQGTKRKIVVKKYKS